MSNYVGPEIPNDGLVCMLDAANIKSYNPAENLALYSQDFSNSAVWGNSNCNITPTLPAPDGTNTAALITCNGTSPTLITQIIETSVTGTGIITSSVYAKAATSTTFTLNTYYSGDTEVNITFTLTGAGSTSTPASSTITAVGNGWYLCTIQTPARVNAGTVVAWRIWPTVRPTATAGLGCYFWGAQLNTGSYARPYTPTTSSVVTASTTWTDISGNGNNMTLTNSPSFSNANGGVLQFNGINQYGSLTSLNYSATTFTIIAGSRYSGATRGRVISSMVNNWLFGHWGSGSEEYHPQSWVYQGTANDTNWRIYAATEDYSGDLRSFYVNNSAIVTNSTAGSAGFNGLSVGRWGAGASEYSTCEVSFIQVYNRILTTQEITQTYIALRSRFGI